MGGKGCLLSYLMIQLAWGEGPLSSETVGIFWVLCDPRINGVSFLGGIVLVGG